MRWDQLHKRRFVEGGKHKPVVPVRFVSTCPKGHIDDLNRRGFVHPGGRRCERPLWLEQRGTSGGRPMARSLGDSAVRNRGRSRPTPWTGKERSLCEAAGARTSAPGRYAGKRTWSGQFVREACEVSCRLLVRTASNACFPQTMRIISLPESDAGLAARVSQHRDRLKAADDLGALESFRMIPELAAAFADVDDAAVVAEYRRQRDGGGGADVPVKDAELEILDKGDARIGEDDPRSEFFAETLDRAKWDRDGDPPLVWNKTDPGPSVALAVPGYMDPRFHGNDGLKETICRALYVIRSSLGHHAPSRLSAAVLPAAVGCMPIEGIGPVVFLLGFYPVADLGLGPHDRLAPRPSESDAFRKPTGALKRIQPGRTQGRTPQDLGTTKKDVGHGASPFLAVAGATREVLSTYRTAEFKARCPGEIGTIFRWGLGVGSRGMPGSCPGGC